MSLDRPRLQSWMEKHHVALTPEAVGELLGIASVPEPLNTARRPSLVLLADGRVTDAQARAFAAYREGEPETVWYRAIPGSGWEGEFDALRDVGADLLDARALLRNLFHLVPVFEAARRYRDCWTPGAVMSVNMAAREMTEAVRKAEELMTTDRDVHGRAASA